MNMLVQPQRTPAENALVDAFAERIASLPGNPAVVLKRDAAIEAIKGGLPTRRVESWHYTDFRRLLTNVPPHDPAAAAAAVEPLIAGSTVLAILNGVSARVPAAFSDVTVRRLEEMLLDGSFAAALEAQGDDDAVGAINAAFAGRSDVAE
ncbi:MAG TPA: Fe-S cluster assembly protein SufD, partial [Rhizobiales bacterium]|nr:Fe-S cluster assembly protein SufD [Hyphomicrobiales bacterium]